LSILVHADSPTSLGATVTSARVLGSKAPRVIRGWGIPFSDFTRSGALALPELVVPIFDEVNEKYGTKVEPPWKSQQSVVLHAHASCPVTPCWLAGTTPPATGHRRVS
jgi:hypothetical protein